MSEPVIDHLDARLLRELALQPRAGVMELARRLGVARGTVQTRLDKLVKRGVITGFGPQLDLTELGYGVEAFTTLEIAQGHLGEVIAHLEKIPEVLEAHAMTGPGDLHVRVVARTNEDLMTVLNAMLDVQGITRTTTQIALSAQIPFRTVPLIDQEAQLAAAHGRGDDEDGDEFAG